MNNNRIDSIDIAKGIGIICVVIGHLPTPPIPIQRFIYNFHMPLFFFLSGLFLNENKYLFKDFILLKAKTLLIPLAFFCVFVRLMQYIPDFDFGSNVLDLGIGGGPLWFLPVLFVSELLVFSIWKLTDKQLWRTIFIVICVVLTLVIDYFSPIQPVYVFAPHSLPMACFFFSLGSILSGHVKEYYTRINGIYLFVGLICFVFLLVFTLSTLDFNNMCYGHLAFGLLGCLIAFIGIIMILVFSKFIDKKLKAIKPLLLYCGQNSLIIFGTHLSFKGLYDRLFGIMTFDNILGYLFGYLFVLMGVVLCIEFINRKLKWCIGKF